MPIYKQKKWYYVKVQINGEKWTPAKAQMMERRWRTKKEARQAEAELRTRVAGIQKAKVTLTTPMNLDLLTLCNEYLADAKVSCLGHDTFAGKKRFCKEILKRWGNIACVDVTVHMAQKYLLERADKVSNNSFNVYRKEGRRLFEWGKKQGLIPRDCINPFAEIEKKPHESGKPRPAPIDSVISAYLVATPDQKDLLISYLVMGARKSEILKMTWDDIDFENRIYALHTRKSRARTIKTTYHEMPTLLYEIFQRRFIKRHPILPYVFWHRFWDRKLKDWRDDRYQQLNKFTDKLCKKAKVPPFKLHQLRHLATTILKDEANMSLAKLQRFLRHDHQKTTEIYAGHIETGTKKQTDFLADFWTDKLDLTEDQESIPVSINQEK